jgi:biotin carboxyl carrier protein
MPRYHIEIEEREYDITLEYRSERYLVTCNGRTYEIERHELNDSRALLLIDNESLEVDVHSHDAKGTRSVFMAGTEIQGTIEDYSLAQMRKAAGKSHGPLVERRLKAPMPGLVLDIRVKPGDRVVKGEPLIVIEAMKMENIIRSSGEAVVKLIVAAKGKSIDKGDTLLEFEA